ncbi:MAG: hypothetical protein Q8S08_03440 [Halomonas sp.]|nr:DUF6694 family lipoprotein [Halomonas sp.]MDP3534426.1 hypothetical protein [Halomonas sp.]
MPAAVVSVDKVRESLPAYKRNEFDQALTIIAMSSFSGVNILNPHRMNAAEIAESANAYMHGLTGDEIIERADKMLRERRARERDQALRTLNRLEEKEANAEQDRQQLTQVSIDQADYYLSTSPYGAPEPVIELAVANATEQTLSQLMLRGELSSPEHDTQWVDETFLYVISGGLAPGETGQWSLAPNRFGPWGDPQIPRDVRLTITLEGVRDSEGNPLWNSPPLTESEAARLEALRKDFAGIRLAD